MSRTTLASLRAGSVGRRPHHRDFPTANRAAKEAGKLAAESGDPGLLALARDIDAHVAAYVGDHERSPVANLSGIADAQRSGDTYDVVNLLVKTAVDLMYLDRLDGPIAYADILYALGACATQEMLDPEACRCFGAAEALYTEHGLTAVARVTGPIVRTQEALRERLGDRFATLAALGSTDPDRAIGLLLGDAGR